MGKKKKLHPILKILIVLFVVFLSLFIASNSGYYEAKIRDKVIVTDEKIKEFEEKLQNGEEIDIDSFLGTDVIDYSSPMSNLGDKLTSGVENFVFKGMKIFGDILKSLF